MDLVPVYRCRRARSPIHVDGVLDETAWARAESVAMVTADAGAVPRQSTAARLMWDDDYLYVAFECADDDIWGTTTERDHDIYMQEVVEVFVDAASCGTAYVEIEVSPLNAVLDLFMLWRDDRRRGLWGWDSLGLKTAVTVDGDPWHRGTADRRWTVEMAIPMVDFEMAPHLPPQPGDTWRINLYRIDRGEQGIEYSAWSPPRRLNYHTPSRFGVLLFVD
jgi:hypothetical protein